jgi:hypothetical protein
MAAIAAFAVGIYNFISFAAFNQKVYFPIFCGFFCLLLWWNIKGQRKFYEKMKQEKEKQ